MIYSLVESAVREAADKAENRTDDLADWPEGIVWNFVDADCYMSGLPKYFKDDQAYYEAFDEIVDNLVNEMRVSAAEEVQLELAV